MFLCSAVSNNSETTNWTCFYIRTPSCYSLYFLLDIINFSVLYNFVFVFVLLRNFSIDFTEAKNLNFSSLQEFFTLSITMSIISNWQSQWLSYWVSTNLPTETVIATFIIKQLFEYCNVTLEVVIMKEKSHQLALFCMRFW